MNLDPASRNLPASVKVVHLTTAHPAADARIFHKECRSLAAEGYQVVLFAIAPRDEILHGVQVRAVPHAAGRLQRMTKRVFSVYIRAVREKADIYHFHDPELIPAALLLKLAGKRVIYDAHEDLPRTFQYKHYLPKWLKPILMRLAELLENLAARSFDSVVTATPQIAERFRRINSRTTVVQNFPEFERHTWRGAPPWRSRPNVVAYVGNLFRERGAYEIVNAIGVLPSRLDATLVIAGDIQPALHRELESLPGWRRTQYVGWVNRVGVAQILSTSRVGLVLMHPMSNFVSSWPVKLFEYMAAGIPVIASDFPLWREIVEDAGCGLLVDPLDPHAIASAIEYLLCNPKEAEEMGKRGRIAVERRYSWAKQKAALLELYSSLVPLPPHDVLHRHGSARLSGQ